MNRSRLLVAALVALSASVAGPWAHSAQATTITVDANGGGDFLFLQDGIDSAAVGDTVLVAPGTYSGSGNEDLDFRGTDLVLRSALGSDVTIIDGEGSGRALLFQSGETAAAVVEGFTITRAPTGSPIRIVGGSAPTIRQCVVIDNDVLTGSGGAVFVMSSSPSFESCVFADNSTTAHGGAVAIVGGAPTFTDCAFVGNFADGRGGAIWLDDASPVTITGSTITGNRANVGLGGYDGGGLLLSGSSSATLERTILWANRGDLGDDAWVVATASLTFTCSDVDPARVGGGGVITYGGGNQSDDPLFCQPAHCLDEPWALGVYTLASNSPLLPAYSTCGFRVGAYGTGCGTAVAWTGAGATDAWEDPANWSTGVLPGPGDHVLIDHGNVVLDSTVSIGRITQCPNGAEPDTFTILSNGVLQVAASGGALARDQYQSNMLAGDGRIVDGSVFCPDCGGHPDCPSYVDCNPLFWFPANARWRIEGGGFHDYGSIWLDGFLEVLANTTVALDFYLVNAGGDLLGNPPVGLDLRSGSVLLTDRLHNYGMMAVGPGAVLDVSGTIVNEVAATLALQGDLLGNGQLRNHGYWQRSAYGSARAPGDTSHVAVDVENARDDSLATVGQIEVTEGTLQFSGALTNRGEVTVGSGAALDLPGTAVNEAAGTLTLTGGHLTGAGTLQNLGVVAKSSPSVSAVTPLIENRFDPATGDRGSVAVAIGALSVSRLDNEGDVTVGPGGVLAVTSDLASHPGAVLAGRGTIDVSSATGLVTNQGIVSPGLSTGKLGYVGAYESYPTTALHVEIGGTTPGIGHDQLNVTGPAVWDGALHVQLVGGFTPVEGDSFEIATVSGPGPREVSAAPAFDCFSGLQLPGGIWLEPIETPGSLWLVARDTTVSNAPPAAVPDIAGTDWATPLTLSPLGNDGDGDGDDLSLVRLVTTGALGVAFLDPGDTTITYLPPEGFAGADTVGYHVTDCNGGLDSTVIVITVSDPTPVAEIVPPQGGALLHSAAPNPFGPVTRIRFDMPRAGTVNVSVYDVRGRRVRVLADGQRDAGTFVEDWWGRDERGRAVAAGVYFVRLETRAGVETRKVVRVR